MLLVTGGAGYIGSHFVKGYLTQNPHAPVLVVDNLSEGHAQALQLFPSALLVQQDIGDSDAMINLLHQYSIDTVVHFAASCYVGESQAQPEKYFQNNVVKSLNLLHALEFCGVRKVVFSSSCATYGVPQVLPIDETHPQSPINVYGSTKLMVEQALHAYAVAKQWSYVTLRYFNAAGADVSGLMGEQHQPETHLIPLALQTAQGKYPALQVYGTDYDTRDGTCVRDYIHVADLVSAHLKAIDYVNAHRGGEAFNLGTAQGASVLEIVEMCRQVTGREIPVELKPRRSGDPACLIASAEKANRLLQWLPQHDLRSIVETAWVWEQSSRFSG